MKTAIVTVCDTNYVEQTKYLFGALRYYAKWTGELVLLSNGLHGRMNEVFEKHGVHVIPIPREPFSWAKTAIFNTFMRNWDKILYLDQDFFFLRPIAPLFDQQGYFLADRECCPIAGHFHDVSANPALWEEIKANYDVQNVPSFIAAAMMFETKIITDTMLTELCALRDRYRSINKINGIMDGSADQPILQLYFYKKWSQLEGVKYWGCRKEDSIALHCTHWHAPWHPASDMHIYWAPGLEAFNAMS